MYVRGHPRRWKAIPGGARRCDSGRKAVGTGTDGQVEFGDVLAVSGTKDRSASRNPRRSVAGEVLEQGRGAKILVFHYKRKKQYKKLRGHRQAFTSVRITEIAYGGQNRSKPRASEERSQSRKKVSPGEKKPRPRSAGEGSKARRRNCATKKALQEKAGAEEEKQRARI